jgi:DNA-binding NtrC family response regulator
MKTLKRVLVVDDDPVVQRSFDRVLSGKGYAVISAANAAEALARLANEEYDAVYTDIRMPGMNGLALAGRLKAKRPWLPVVIVTGYGSAESETLAKKIGVSGFLHKPLSPEMIEASATDVLRAPAPVPAKAEAAAPVAAPGPIVATPTRSFARSARNVGLFFAAPFIGLVYAIALPFVGLGLLAWEGYRALAEKTSKAK